MTPDGHFSEMIRYFFPHLPDGRLAMDQDDLERIAGLVWQADPVGDAFAASIGRSSDPRRALADFETALEHGIETLDAPSIELVDLFRDIDTTPDGIDLARVREGVRALRRIDPVTFWGLAKVLGFYFGPYTPNVARSLTSNTASLENAVKRQIETGRYFTEMIRPEGLGRFTAGGKATIRLRLLHSHVRNYLNRGGRWDESLCGAPISQFDILLGSLASSYLIALAANREGYDFTSRELDDLAQLAGYHAKLMGVPEIGLCRNAHEANERAFVFLATARADADEEARDQVLRSLLGQPMPLFGNRFDEAADVLSVAYARRMMGSAVSDRAGDLLRPRRLASVSLPVFRLFLLGFNPLRRHFEALDRHCFRAMDHFWFTMIPDLLERHTGSRNKDFTSGTGRSAIRETAAAA